MMNLSWLFVIVHTNCSPLNHLQSVYSILICVPFAPQLQQIHNLCSNDQSVNHCDDLRIVYASLQSNTITITMCINKLKIQIRDIKKRRNRDWFTEWISNVTDCVCIDFVSCSIEIFFYFLFATHTHSHTVKPIWTLNNYK